MVYILFFDISPRSKDVSIVKLRPFSCYEQEILRGRLIALIWHLEACKANYAVDTVSVYPLIILISNFTYARHCRFSWLQFVHSY